MKYYVYIVRCNDGSYYTGISNDVKKRIEKHNSGKGAKYLRGSRLPVYLFKTIECANKSEALKLEAKIKKMRRIDKELIIAGAPIR